MNKKGFIEKLYLERSDYRYPSQAENIANSLDALSNDIYSESQRFIFELIQNADDSAGSKQNEVHFGFHTDCVIVSHHGEAFSENDITSLTSIGSSTKKSDLTKTGYKGIGFKSVFGRSERVSIISGGYQFRFDRSANLEKMPWQIIPIWTETTDLPIAAKEFLSQNKYSVSTIIETRQTDTLAANLTELIQSGQILLFLRNITRISVSNGGSSSTIERKDNSKLEASTQTTLLKDNRELSTWITKSFSGIPIPAETIHSSYWMTIKLLQNLRMQPLLKSHSQ